MESNAIQNFKTKLSLETINYKQVLEQTHVQALLKNEVETAKWESYKKEHVELNSRLLTFRDSLSQQVMVPLGKKALMKGNLVHTNEIMVCLGDGWFAKRSAKQACDICQRRIEHCNETLNKLEKERNLLTSRKSLPLEQEVFGAYETEEIVEPYDEEEERKWKERHRQKEKEYRQKLAELKNQNTKIETEDDLWKHLDALDALDLQEDELNRLSDDEEEEEDDDDESEGSDEDDESEGSDEDEYYSNDETENYDTGQNQAHHGDKIQEKPKLKRRVSFKEDVRSEQSDQPNEETDDVIKIYFKHSEEPSYESQSLEGDINSPADVFSQYARQKAPKSILKPSPSLEMSPNSFKDPDEINVAPKYAKAAKHKEIVPQDESEPLVQAIGEVMERTVEAPIAVTNDERPVSRFKAARLAKR